MGSARFPVVGVGASAGGLEAFTQFLTQLPLDTGVGFVLIQHLDPDHESALVQILSRATSLPVVEITKDQPVQPDRVHVIPRDTSLTLVDGRFHLEPRTKLRVPHRPIDAFLESLAQDRHELAIGVILSGTGSDGTLGLEAIKAEGGITFAQDDSARHDSMPRSAVAAGCVDLVLSPADIAAEVVRIARHPSLGPEPLEPPAIRQDDRGSDPRGEASRAEATAHQDDDTPLPSGDSTPRATAADSPPARAGGRRTGGSSETPRPGEETAGAGGARGVEEGYRKILAHLHRHSGVDFSLYKSTTIRRRINRRMILTRHETPESYAGFLRGQSQELDALYSDVLISVTSFFRNPEMFEALQHKVLPELLKQRTDDPVRCWVLGCSTGQEAYSIAMSFLEASERAPRPRPLQIFATDLNDALLDKARHGLYAKSLAEEIAPGRLSRFFVEEEGGYRIKKTLREMVVFARQNLIADPPFSRMDVISCRNLLIYLEPSLQKKAMPTFHYALKPHGYLLLGASESIGGFTELFEVVDKKHRIFSRKSAPTPAFHLPVARGRRDPRLSTIPRRREEPLDPSKTVPTELDAQREADRITVNQFAPPGVLVNSDLQIVQFRGPTGPFLEPSAGKASFDVLKMAREGLMLPLRAAITEARNENKAVRRDHVRIVRDGLAQEISLEVVPLRNLRERSFLILFETSARSGTPPLVDLPAAPPTAEGDERQRITELETDLTETREYLLSIQDQHEAANEELQASNEEVQSANEELQSVNEELETSKEELESANEELTTVNEEMQNRNSELNRLNSDLVNLQTSTRLAILLLGRDLTIRRYSPGAEALLELTTADVGRPVRQIRHGLSLPSGAGSSAPGAPPPPVDLESIAADVGAGARDREIEVLDRGGRWLAIRVRPYMTPDNQVDGVVLVLVDIDHLKHTEQALAAARDYAESIVATVREPLVVLDARLHVESANVSFYGTFRVSPGETIGTSIFDLGNGQWNIPRLRELLEDVLPHCSTIEDFEIDHVFDTIGPRTMRLNARCVTGLPQASTRILLAIEDITDRRQVEETLKKSHSELFINEERLRTLADNMSQFAWTADTTGWIYWYNRRWYDYTGTTLVEAQGWGWRTVVHPDQVDRVVKRLQHSWDTGLPWEDTFSLRGKDGNYRWFLSRALPIRDEEGRVIRWFGTNTDVTERREMEERIERQAAQLTSEALRKDEFLAMLGHELRNPLAPITTALHLLRQDAANESPTCERARTIIERQVGQLTHLVNDLLEMSRITSGRIQLREERVSLADVTGRAVEAARPLIERHRHELTLSLPEQPIWLSADPVRLEQVVVNLLNNAAKYTADRGRIWLSIQEEDGAAVLRVRDTGVGIAPDVVPRVFDLFTQVDRSLNRADGGLGIGLSLVRRLTELHGGTVDVTSVLGQGSEFVVRLPIPLTFPDPAPQSPPVELDRPGQPRRVLVVDDNVDSAESVASLLQAWGHQIRTVHDGSAVLPAVLEFRPDVLLLDIGLPGVDGYEIAARVRRDPDLGHIHLIAMTGYGRESDRVRARAAGFDHHLVKPLDFQELKRLLAAGPESPVKTNG